MVYPDGMATIPVPIEDAPPAYVLAAVLEAVQALGATLSTRMTALEAQMADLRPSLDRLESAVRNLDLGGSNDALTQALAAERARTAELVTAAAAAEATRLDLASAEASEDVQQDAALADAVTAYNGAVAETDSAKSRIDSAAATLEGFGTPETPADPGTPPVVDEPAPVDPGTPVDPTTGNPDPTVPVVDPGEPAPVDPNAPVFPPN